MGLVSQVFDEEDLAQLPGKLAIGHTRYSTSGGSTFCNAQPVLVKDQFSDSEIALAHNGNLLNTDILRDDLIAQGIELEADADTELIAHLLALAPAGTWEERFHYLMRRIRGAYSLTIMTPDTLFAVRDPFGVRPLCLGSLEDGWVVASETCALDNIGATYVRDIEPGEVVQIDATGVHSFFPMDEPKQKAMCTFEYIYIARPDSRLRGESVYLARERAGAELAREYPVEADVVVGVPDTGIPAAIGYAHESGIPFREALIRNRYVGRTFIQPNQRLRDIGVAMKFNALDDVVRGKRVVVIDDSIVRGTTKPRVVELLRKAGAKEIHIRIASPPIVSPCFLGVDMATKGELIAANKTIDEIRQHVNADSFGYLSLAGLMRATRQPEDMLCNACFTGVYPTDVQDQLPMVAARAPVSPPQGETFETAAGS